MIGYTMYRDNAEEIDVHIFWVTTFVVCGGKELEDENEFPRSPVDLYGGGD